MADDTKTIDSLLNATQDLFILQALQAGATNDAVRQFLHVDKWRVTKVSKVLKSAKKPSR
jgi:DNA-binding protein YbaB